MLSYRHAFHAGNHADILKHSTLCILLKHFTKKEKPFTYVDTHSGAGMYTLDSEWARKTGEAKEGIEKVLEELNHIDDVPNCIGKYLEICKKNYKENLYAGSPRFAYELSREQDSVTLSELHPADFELLYKELGEIERVHVHRRNGFELLKGFNFPTRSLVLIDPSYETDEDYDNVFATVEAFYKHRNTATIAVWYPLVGRRAGNTAELKQRLYDLVPLAEKFLCAEFSQKHEEESQYGMYGSCMAIINPPWHSKEEITEGLAFFSKLLGMDYSVN